MIIRMLIWAALTFASVGNVAAGPPAASVAGQLTGLHSGRGTCYLALFASPDGFPRHPDKAVRTLHLPVRDKVCAFAFDNLPPGTYALAVYHDENDNNRLDTNFLGLPTERFGFSNNARRMMFFPPSFEAARFVVAAPKTSISLRLR